MLDSIKARVISLQSSIIFAMKQMDNIHVKSLFVFDGDKFVELLTIGDIQRAIIKGVPLNEKIGEILNSKKIYASEGESMDSIRSKMEKLRAECMPVLDVDGNLIDVIFWKDIAKTGSEPPRPPLNLPVVIMAGGKGTRLRPITNVIPKPLIPIGDKTILEEILDQFESIGCNKFYMSVNYKSDILKYFLENLPHSYDINYLEETTPLGTIGGISLLKGQISTPFFVSNCDILIDQDYRDVYKYHIDNNNDITIITAVKSLRIPYGVIDTGESGLMTGLQEKPEQTYMINTGVYILNPELIDEIPVEQIYHITDLMEKIRARGGRVGCFPVSEHAWKDIGEWPEYLKMIEIL
jgi:dTDP-glucose pyrophosphorylase